MRGAECDISYRARHACKQLNGKRLRAPTVVLLPTDVGKPSRINFFIDKIYFPVNITGTPSGLRGVSNAFPHNDLPSVEKVDGCQSVHSEQAIVGPERQLLRQMVLGASAPRVAEAARVGGHTRGFHPEYPNVSEATPPSGLAVRFEGTPPILLAGRGQVLKMNTRRRRKAEARAYLRSQGLLQ